MFHQAYPPLLSEMQSLVNEMQDGTEFRHGQIREALSFAAEDTANPVLPYENHHCWQRSLTQSSRRRGVVDGAMRPSMPWLHTNTSVAPPLWFPGCTDGSTGAMGWTRSRSASDGNPPYNALTRRLLQSTGIPTFSQASFGPMTRQRVGVQIQFSPSTRAEAVNGVGGDTQPHPRLEAISRDFQSPNFWIQPARLPMQGDGRLGRVDAILQLSAFRFHSTIPLEPRPPACLFRLSQEFSSLLQLPFPALSHGQQVMRAVRFGRRPCDFNQTTRIRSRHRALASVIDTVGAKLPVVL
jgi:hypothetical protein